MQAEAALDRIGNIRLVLALIGLVLLILPLFTRQGDPWWGLVAVVIGFLFLGKRHDQVSARLRRATAAEGYYGRELERLDEQWRSFPDDGEDLIEDDPSDEGLARTRLAVDLDLFGPASLFQLLNRAVTMYGRRVLGDWLLSPADADVARARQVAARELAEALDVREAMAVAAGGDGKTPLRDARLLQWAENVDPLPGGKLLRVAGVVQPVVLAASVAVFVFTSAALPMVVAVLVHLGILLGTRRAVTERAAKISTPDRALSRYAELIDAIEAAPLEAPLSAQLKQSLQTDGAAASDRIRELNRIVELLDARLNVFFSLTIGPLLLWELNLITRTERWQGSVGRSLRGWFETIGHLEALASLGAFAAQRPDYVDPQLVAETGVYRAKGLHHPLLDRGVAVANDIELGGEGSVLLLSGSNMSGKSTFLRSIGLSHVLARAGAVAPATSLAISTLHMVTSIRVTDSLARGTSHFYAELERIKETLDAATAHEGRVLYLLDEMLHGTNSKERYIGAASVIRWMSERAATGVVTTHDLALARVEGELAEGRVRNMHFGDDVQEGKIHFDFTLKSGPVQSTNALRLMRAIGIDIDLVEDETSASTTGTIEG